MIYPFIYLFIYFLSKPHENRVDLLQRNEVYILHAFTISRYIQFNNFSFDNSNDIYTI